MNLAGHTILITGGGTGIGRGLTEALHQRGNRIIIAGRNAATLAQVAIANPGIEYAVLDVSDPDSIARVTQELRDLHPSASSGPCLMAGRRRGRCPTGSRRDDAFDGRFVSHA